jgi:hypothetical protein
VGVFLSNGGESEAPLPRVPFVPFWIPLKQLPHGVENTCISLKLDWLKSANAMEFMLTVLGVEAFRGTKTTSGYQIDCAISTSGREK